MGARTECIDCDQLHEPKDACPLRPCPFCGSKDYPPEVYDAREREGSLRQDRFWVECTYDGTRGPRAETSEKAVAQWNERE